MARHVEAMLALKRSGAIAFDYGNNIRKQAFDAGCLDAVVDVADVETVLVGPGRAVADEPDRVVGGRLERRGRAQQHGLRADRARQGVGAFPRLVGPARALEVSDRRVIRRRR